MSNNKTKTEEEIAEIPKEGWKSITLPSEIYDVFYNEWNGHRHEYLLKGITSFSGFMTMLLAEPLQEFKKKSKSENTQSAITAPANAVGLNQPATHG